MRLPPSCTPARRCWLPAACRDPTHFPLILTFLRDGRVPLPESPLERAALRQEAEFYALTVRPAARLASSPASGAAVGRCCCLPPRTCGARWPVVGQRLLQLGFPGWFCLPMGRPHSALEQELVAAIDDAEAARADEAAAQAAEQARQVGMGCEVAHASGRALRRPLCHSLCPSAEHTSCCLLLPLLLPPVLLLPLLSSPVCTATHSARHLRQAEAARARDYIAAHQAELLKAFGKAMEREQVRRLIEVASGRRAGAAQIITPCYKQPSFGPFALSLRRLSLGPAPAATPPAAAALAAGGNHSGTGEPGGVGCGAAARARTDCGAAGRAGGPG